MAPGSIADMWQKPINHSLFTDRTSTHTTSAHTATYTEEHVLISPNMPDDGLAHVHIHPSIFAL